MTILWGYENKIKRTTALRATKRLRRVAVTQDKLFIVAIKKLMFDSKTATKNRKR